MSIKITQPFSFESQLPNFDRDQIDSSAFTSGDPLALTSAERSSLVGIYDIGHIVYDTNTKKHYVVGRTQQGAFEFVLLVSTPETIRTMNHEQLSDSGLGDINILDGYYFPNAIQDGDGNWYGAVIIGDQVWMAENLKTIHYTDGTEIIESVDYDLNELFCTHHPNNPDEILYNWASIMGGNTSTNDDPSGIQGVAPNGWHIPSVAEFEKLLHYISNQKRHIYSNNSAATAKSLSATSGWVYYNTPEQGWPSVDMGENNSTGFNAVPTGYFHDYNIEKEDTMAVFWTTTEREDDPTFTHCLTIDSENEEPLIVGDFEKGWFCSVRCVSDLTPVQFRDWYVNTHKSMQHHLASVQVQSNWNETNTSSPSYIRNKPDISTVTFRFW